MPGTLETYPIPHLGRSRSEGPTFNSPIRQGGISAADSAEARRAGTIISAPAALIALRSLSYHALTGVAIECRLFEPRSQDLHYLRFLLLRSTSRAACFTFRAQPVRRSGWLWDRRPTRGTFWLPPGHDRNRFPTARPVGTPQQPACARPLRRKSCHV